MLPSSLYVRMESDNSNSHVPLTTVKLVCDKQKERIEFLKTENDELKKTVHLLETQLSLTLFKKETLDLSDNQEDPVSVVKKLQHDIAESTLMNTKCHAAIHNLLVGSILCIKY